MRKLINSFSDERNIIIREVSNHSIPIRWALLSEEMVEDFDHYELISGNVGTVSSSDREEKWRVTIGTNYYSKKVIRQLHQKYDCLRPQWSYDQISAPEWEFNYKFSTCEEVISFLKGLYVLSSSIPRNIEEEVNRMNLIFGLKRAGNNKTKIMFMEREDWEVFGHFIHEHYFESHPILKEAIKELSLIASNNMFIADLPAEQLKKILENKGFEWNESFEARINNEVQK